MTEIVAFSGYARSGKDAAAKVLVDEFKFVRVSFADKLREVLYALNPLVAPTKEKWHVQPKNPVLLQEVIDERNWDDYKNTRYASEIRRLLQRLGTEAGRNVLGENIWVDSTLNVDHPKIVVSDCRFPNEARAVKERGGVVIRITRFGVGPANEHPSETSLDDWNFDYRIDNVGPLEEYRQKIRDLIGSWT